MIRADTLVPKMLVDLSSRDDGGHLGNEKFLCTCHHVIRVDMVEQKFLCTCHHMMMVHIMEQKIPVYLSSGDEGGSS